MNKKSVVGIDLGTSSVKVLKRYFDGNTEKVRVSYDVISPEGWWKGVSEALSKLDLRDVAAVGLSSQVGTYIVDGRHIISWNASAGAKELLEVKEKYSPEIFVREISMPHPNIVSYPIPRLRYIKSRFPEAGKVCMPKDFICEKLTGNWVTDPYSWRGLANLKTGDYSEYFLKELGFEKWQLPAMIKHTEAAGYAQRFFPAGTPVFTGLNDYYASLLGMGIQQTGDMFDITGTSEHLGIIENRIDLETSMVSGPYLQGNVHYGVTASCGPSLNFAMSIWDKEICIEEIQKEKPPVFLPYLNGERAPIWDPDARGMFFGIQGGCRQETMAYAVLEGVTFSLYHIYEHMGKPEASMMKVSGGAAGNKVLNQLKAELFGIPVAVLKETDTSALGAVMVAEQGLGIPARESQIAELVQPTGEIRDWLMKRYAVYKELYPAVKQQYQKLKEINK